MMKRREFSKLLGMAALALQAPRLVRSASGAAPQFSITMDDFNWRNPVHLTAEQRNQAILKALADHKTRAALFVIGRNADAPEGMSLLRQWDEAGHAIG